MGTIDEGGSVGWIFGGERRAPATFLVERLQGAALMLPAIPKAKELLADKGYDADCIIPSKSNRKTAIPYDAALYKQRHKIENMFGRLKNWRRIHTRYDRCAHIYFSAICIAAAVVFWL